MISERGVRRRLPVLAGAALCFALFSATPAFAAEKAAPPSELLFMVQIFLLLALSRSLGELMQRLGQPAVIGALLAGLLLGPSVLGLLAPGLEHMLFPPAPAQKALLKGVGEIGVLLLLLLAGMETDLALVRKVGRIAIGVSASGIIVPFACGAALVFILPAALLRAQEHRLVAALFLGTALSISSVKIVAMVVRQMNFMRRDIGQIILASAVIDDTIGWIIIAITFGIASAGGLQPMSIAESIIGTLVFLVASLTIGRRVVFAIIRWANDTFVSELPVVSAVIAIMLAMALATSFIGVHEVLGAFVAGILVGESPILTRQIDEQLRGLTTALFVPVFFGLAGLGANLRVLADPTTLLFEILLVLIASLGKFSGAFLGGSLTGLRPRQSLALAFGMNARGSTEVIVATIGLSMGILSQTLYTMIVTMAIVTTMIMPPTLRWALNRLPLNPEERRRLESESFEERGFVANLERLLLVADETNEGKFAARIFGLLASTHGSPVTLLQAQDDKEQADKTNGKGEQTSDADFKKQEKEGLEELKAIIANRGLPAGDISATEKTPEPIHVTLVTTDKIGGDEVRAEAEKGYDLLGIGLPAMTSGSGGFDPKIAEIANGFTGAVTIIAARGLHCKDPIAGPINILAPVNGSAASRRGADVAFALAQALKCPLHALYVGVATPERRSGIRDAAGRDEAAVLNDLANVAEHYQVELKTAVRTGIAPEVAILREARNRGSTLIVMGVSRRSAEVLSFGAVADAVLEALDRSLILVSGE